MQRSDFSFDLPKNLIAQNPAPSRTASRMLCLDGSCGLFEDRLFTDLMDIVSAGDLLVLNDTKVIPARLMGHKSSGGKVEILIDRLLDNNQILAHVKASKSPKIGSLAFIEGAGEIRFIDRLGELFILEYGGDENIMELLELKGHVPLPPYINRVDDEFDRQRYQTVYAKNNGAVAAPTAGLHFDSDFINKLEQKGVRTAFVTLHVGAGTFQPMRVEKIEEHKMHKEFVDVSELVCKKIKETKANGKRVIAVGTTSLRCLEAASLSGEIMPLTGETDIFLYPGAIFHSVDTLLTNFHLPESTLLMLVCAFAGYEQTLSAYKHAIEQQYRFYSYGDVMFINKRRV